MMTSIIIIILIPMMVYFHFQINQQQKRSQIQSAISQAQLLSFQLEPSVSTRDYQEMNAKLAMLQQDPSLVFATIFLANGTSVAQFSRVENHPIPEFNFSVNQQQQETETQIILISPIYQEQKLLGYLYLQHEKQQLFSTQTENLQFLIIILTASLILAVILAGIFQKFLTQPIRRMVQHISDIYKSNNFERRLNVTRKDELGKLIVEFNQMLNTVQERENELTMHGKQLQRLVEVRTEQLYQKAHFDSLTGLPNRYLLVDRLHQAISKSSRSKSNLALLFLDLDRFKVINDNLGHQNGDLLLKEVAKRLSKLARNGDTIARLGGDEFVFLLENLTSPKDAARTARRIIDSFKTPFRLQEHILHVSTSIGISIHPDDGADDKVLLKNADISMYHAKEKGPGNFSFYSQDMNESSLERLAIESNLRTAIEKNEFYLVYQPQMRLKDNSFKSVEALLRWRNKEVGDISPQIFVPIAEETGLVNQIDLWVISEVCRQLRIWKEQGLTNITVAVNVSAGHLISDTLLEHLKQQILINNINADQIEVEITEAVFVEHTERTIHILTEIKKLGSKIAIDDFGTGYSSLQYIQEFPADTLKLDGMFIRNLEERESSQGIVRSTIILAHSLGLEIVSECVEDQFQLNFLKQHNCDLVQGFMLSKPISPQEVVVLCGH